MPRCGVAPSQLRGGRFRISSLSVAVISIFFESRAGRRLLNETAIQFEVWSNLAINPDGHFDLILIPLDTTPAAGLARSLHSAMAERQLMGATEILPLEGAVVARVDLDEGGDRRTTRTVNRRMPQSSERS